MNRILFAADERTADDRVVLRGRRAQHILTVLQARPGDVLRVGEIDGAIGTGRVEALSGGAVVLQVVLQAAAPEPWIDLLLALPRPKVLKRLWPQLAALGVGRIILINAARVERCYFDTHWLAPGAYAPLLIEGLEQAGTTQLPDVQVRRGFKPFVEDELSRVYERSVKLLAHPEASPAPAVPRGCAAPSVASRPLLAIGPEGGWTSYELELLERHGFTRLSLGPRTLRTDTACIAILGALMPR
jgi:RsmE family RNA methyltransferase